MGKLREGGAKVKFLMDGTEHETGEGCHCRRERCCNCGQSLAHFQGVYGGFMLWCEVCNIEVIKANENKELDPPNTSPAQELPYEKGE
jgi:hypothetical protein